MTFWKDIDIFASRELNRATLHGLDGDEIKASPDFNDSHAEPSKT